MWAHTDSGDNLGEEPACSAVKWIPHSFKARPSEAQLSASSTLVHEEKASINMIEHSNVHFLNPKH